MIPEFILLGLGTLISEDLTCVSAGVLVAQGRLGFVEATAACMAGILAGDMLLFLIGRFGGHVDVLSRWIPEDRVTASAAWIARNGLKVVFLSRFTPGLRLPAYVAAGLVRSRFWAFSGYFLLAAAVWTPLLVGSAAVVGEQALRSALSKESPLAVVSLAGGVFAGLKLRHFEARRRVVGFVRRRLRWEFWPSWAIYAPLAPCVLYLAIKHRSLTLFTAANPGMFSGGLMGESKSEILRHLGRVPGAVAEFVLIPSGARARADHFPVVLKPETGERGAGVAILRTSAEVDAYLRHASKDTILQRYIPGLEFGIYYVRYPSEPHGRVLYITEKVFPFVTGDGKTCLKDLILGDDRAVCLASQYLRAARHPSDFVPARGERVQLVEIGSHCRGAVFLNGSHLITPELEAAVDRISQAHPEFYLGRYDVRAVSREALQRGELTVIELNGVSAEATHIYDPAVSLREAYRVMFRHWRTAFEIGAINRERGFKPMALGALLSLVCRRAHDSEKLRWQVKSLARENSTEA